MTGWEDAHQLLGDIDELTRERDAGRAELEKVTAYCERLGAEVERLREMEQRAREAFGSRSPFRRDTARYILGEA